MITVKNLTKIYQVPQQNFKKSLKNFLWKPTEDKIGVQNISFTVEQGEIVGFVGPNGAGKTTTIKMLSGILTPSEGELEVCGYVPYKQRRLYTKEIGVMMGQRSVLFYDIPVIESLKFFKDVYSINDVDFRERLDFLVDKLELEALLQIPVRKLSLGQRMRCEVVASILHNPKVLFLDEPTIGLDIIAKQKIIDFLQYLNVKFNTTIFLTTHGLNDIDRLCQRIIILDKGAIQYDGGIKNIHSRDKFKIIEVVHKANFDPGMLSDKFEVLHGETNRTRIRVLKEDLGHAMNMLNNESILDVDIALISLEEVIREIYETKNCSEVGELNCG